MTERIIGIDVSKDRLEACRHGDGARGARGARASFANAAAGLRRLRGWLGGDGCRVVFEPTGRYRLELERCLTEAGIAFVKVNPRQARRFAEALGVQARTDRADAAMLARMGAALDLPPSRPVDQAQARSGRAGRRPPGAGRGPHGGEEPGEDASPGPLLRRQNAARLRRIESDLDAVEREIAARIAADEDLAERRRILTSVPGISEIAAAAILTLVPEIGTLGQAQAAKLAGLAPIARQSVGPVARQGLHPRRPGGVARGALHAGTRGHALQPRPRRLRREAQDGRQACQGHDHGDDAKALPARQRAGQGQESMGAEIGSTRTRILYGNAPLDGVLRDDGEGAPARGAVGRCPAAPGRLAPGG